MVAHIDKARCRLDYNSIKGNMTARRVSRLSHVYEKRKARIRGSMAISDQLLEITDGLESSTNPSDLFTPQETRDTFKFSMASTSNRQSVPSSKSSISLATTSNHHSALNSKSSISLATTSNCKSARNSKSSSSLPFDSKPIAPLQEASDFDRCPSGHILKQFRTPHLYSCSVCEKTFPELTIMFGCHECDYDKCESCYGKVVEKWQVNGTAEQQSSIANVPADISNSKSDGLQQAIQLLTLQLAHSRDIMEQFTKAARRIVASPPLREDTVATSGGIAKIQELTQLTQRKAEFATNVLQEDKQLLISDGCLSCPSARQLVSRA